jgi:ketosteroid isomerase-like protein
MQDDSGPLEAERRFFAALTTSGVAELDRVLADDFMLIDVMRGGEIDKAALLAAVGSGQVKFLTIEPGEARVRRYQGTAVVTGRTRMTGRFEEAPWETSSRYTHVFVEQEGRWRLVAAQGTQIAPE